jgi:hypothetical protein
MTPTDACNACEKNTCNARDNEGSRSRPRSGLTLPAACWLILTLITSSIPRLWCAWALDAAWINWLRRQPAASDSGWLVWLRTALAERLSTSIATPLRN